MSSLNQPRLGAFVLVRGDEAYAEQPMFGRLAKVIEIDESDGLVHCFLPQRLSRYNEYFEVVRDQSKWFEPGDLEVVSLGEACFPRAPTDFSSSAEQPREPSGSAFYEELALLLAHLVPTSAQYVGFRIEVQSRGSRGTDCSAISRELIAGLFAREPGKGKGRKGQGEGEGESVQRDESPSASLAGTGLIERVDIVLACVRTREVLGEGGDRIRQMAEETSRHFGFPRDAVDMFVERCEYPFDFYFPPRDQVPVPGGNDFGAPGTSEDAADAPENVFKGKGKKGKGKGKIITPAMRREDTARLRSQFLEDRLMFSRDPNQRGVDISLAVPCTSALVAQDGDRDWGPAAMAFFWTKACVESLEILLLSKLKRRASYAFRLLREYTVRVRPGDRGPAGGNNEARGLPPVTYEDWDTPVTPVTGDWGAPATLDDWGAPATLDDWDAPAIFLPASPTPVPAPPSSGAPSAARPSAGGSARVVPVVNLADERVGEAAAGETAAEILRRLGVTGAQQGSTQLVVASSGRVLDAAAPLPSLPAGETLRLFEWLLPRR